jgi:hypothetical protein
MPIPGPFGGYTTHAQTISAPAKVEIAANMAKLLAMVPNPAVAVKAASPHFEGLQPELAVKLRAEISALAAVFAAAP